MNDKFEILREKYINSLAISRQKLSSLISSLDHDATAADQLRQLGHRLAGSGAIYGFQEVSGAARLLEQACWDDAEFQECPKVAARRLIDTIDFATRANPPPNSVEFVTERNDFSSVDVLIIEDDAEQSDLICAWLQQQGAQIRVASSVEEARELLSARTFNFILCDLELQDGRWTGSEFLRTLQENNATIIMITSHGDFNARLAAVRAGAQAFIQKPFTAQELNRVLSTFVRNTSIEDKHVLIIEDDDAQSQLYTEVLKTIGVNVHAAQDPKRAYDVMSKTAIDLIITDVHLPVCSGIEFGRLVRHNPKFNHIPILFMSTDTSTDTKLSALEIAAEEFVTKPIEPWRLAVIVESRLRSRMARDSRD